MWFPSVLHAAELVAPRARAERARRRAARSRCTAARLCLEPLEDRCLLSINAALVEGYGVLPLRFEANQGQADAAVQFLSRGSGYALWLNADEAVLNLRKPAGATAGDPEAPFADSGSTLRMHIVGGNASTPATGRDRLVTQSHYFIGNDPSRWQTDVVNYARVEYQDVYAGIDLVYYGNQRQLEYDFIVAPGADPGVISLNFAGADRMEIDARGDLVLSTAAGEIRQHKPILYQEVDGARREISGGYVLKGDRVGFQVGAYDAGTPLVIDPVLSYSTYLGGEARDIGTAIAVDAAGNAYVTGLTSSIDFPTVPAAPPKLDGVDVFVAKLAADGSALLYSVYLGGSSLDEGRGIAVDGAGDAYVMGQTWSPDFPTVKPLQPAYGGGGSDAFVAKLSADGSQLVYSTYLGGAGRDGDSDNIGDSHPGTGIAVDAAGNAYVTGRTSSIDFPTVSALQPVFGGGLSDAFVSHLAADGSQLVYSTYLGGSEEETGKGIAVDTAGNAYVTGWTLSPDLPTAKPLQPARGGNSWDAFVAKIVAGGSAFVYSTYLGGNTLDRGAAIAVDAAGNAYVTGVTGSEDFPTVNPLQPALAGGDAFVTKVNADGSALVYSTYLGGGAHPSGVGGDEAGYGIAVDAAGNAYVTGVTSSSTFPRMNPLPYGSGDGDAFVTKLNASGSALVYSTYLGGGDGPRHGAGFGIAVDAAGNAYVTGVTYTNVFPTVNAFQPTFRGVSDAFVAKIGDATSTLITATLTADNHYALYHGKADGGGLALVGRNETGTAGNPGAVNWSLPETFTFSPAADDHVYVVAWDDGAPAMWLGQFELPGGALLSNVDDWEFVVAGGANPGEFGEAPSVEQVRGEIAGATWAAPAASAPQGSSPWGTIPGISPAARFVWHDSLSSSPSSQGHYVIFRSKAPLTANQAPTTTGIPNVTVNEDAADTVLDLRSYFDDADDGAAGLTFTIQANTNPGLFFSTIINGSTGPLTLAYAVDANGTADLTVRATDTGGLFVEVTFTVTVNPVNDAPSFTRGADQTVNEDAGPQTVVGWASGISAGPANEAGQVLTFVVPQNTNPGLFAVPPAVNALTGDLTYTPAADAFGSATITLVLRDDGGTADGGVDTSPAPTFIITVTVKPVTAQFNWRLLDHFGGPDNDKLTIFYHKDTGDITFIDGPDTVIDYPFEEPSRAQAYVNPETWPVRFDASGSSGAGAPVVSYRWAIGGEDVSTLATFTHEFPAQGTYAVTLTVTDGTEQARSVTQDVVVRDYLIVSVGDSLAAGEGSPDVPVEWLGPIPLYPAVWQDPRAHRSHHAGPALAAAALEQADPHTSVTFISVAASGASVSQRHHHDATEGGMLSAYSGIDPAGNNSVYAPQIDQVKELVKSRRPIDALLMSFGANDIKFADIIKELLLGLDTFGEIEGEFLDRVTELRGRYAQMAEEIRGLDVKNVYITEYPDPTHDSAGNFVNLPDILGPGGVSGILAALTILVPGLATPAFAALLTNYGLSAAKLEWAHSHIVQRLNNEVRRAAMQYGWHLVDGITSQFVHHGYAAGDQPGDERWIVRLSDALVNQGNYQGMFHPNVKGQLVYKERLLAQMLAGSIHGQVFEDLNLNGARDSGEAHGGPGFPTWQVFLDANNNGQRDPGETAAATDDTGHYAFNDLAPGDYVVRVAPLSQNEWFPTATPTARVTVTSDLGREPAVRDFGVARPGSLAGRVVFDLNRNGRADIREPGLFGRTVYLDQNNNGVFDAVRTFQPFRSDVRKAIPDATRVRDPDPEGGGFEDLPGMVVSTLTVAGVEAPVTGVTVQVDVTHPRETELELALVSPRGRRVELFDDGFNGGTSTAALADFNHLDANGTWTLEVRDTRPLNTGQLLGWSLTLETGEAYVTTTGDRGRYVFSDIKPGGHFVRLVSRADDWPLLVPQGGSHSVILDSSAQVDPLDFLFVRPHSFELDGPVEGQRLALDAPEGTRLEDVRAVPNPSPADFPAGVSTPVGFLEFKAEGIPAGGAVTVTLTMPPGTPVNAYYRYGPTPDDPRPHWYRFVYDGTTGARIDGDVITLSFVDGLRGDDDGTANEVVVDPGAPAFVSCGGATNRCFIEQAYRDVLGRQAEDGGLEFWSGRLDQGASRIQVAQAIAGSPESYTLQVQDLYRSYLGRPADPMGLNHFVRILQGGGTPDQVKAAMFGSPEYFQGRSGGTSAGFLTALYQDVLGRPVDPSGGVTWGVMLARGFSRELVARMVLGRREADTIAVDGFYGRFLGRASDPAGLNTFVGALQRGVQERDVIAVIFASLEYDNRLG